MAVAIAKEAPEDLRAGWDEVPRVAGGRGWRADEKHGGTTAWRPAVDISERGDAYMLTVDLPDVEASEVDITLEDGRLTIQGRRHAASAAAGEKVHRSGRGPRAAPPGGRSIVRLRGTLDVASAQELRERLIDVLHRRTSLLIVDLSQVQSCDATGLAVLISTQRRARLLGSVMLLAAPSLPVAKVLRSTGLHRCFTIYPDLPGALASRRREDDARTAPALPLPAGQDSPAFPEAAVG